MDRAGSAPVGVANEKFAVAILQLEQAFPPANPPRVCLRELFQGQAEQPGDGAAFFGGDPDVARCSAAAGAATPAREPEPVGVPGQC
jgi:hypothetical protein